MDKDKVSKPGGKTAPSPKPPTVKTPTPEPGRVAPLFRKIDWFAMLFVFAVIWGIYLFTLAPNVTLEDSGELCTGSFYAGIPHPPGYPFWAIYSWIWTKIIPFSNVAWRVEVGESFASAMACGLVALMVSRAGSMLIEGIEELKGIAGKWENAICVVSGATAGLLLGFGGVMWSESVAINRISLFGVPWVTLVLVCMMRWIYAPHQRRYLYVAMFFFGICATIHQTLLVMAMGVEVMVALAHPRLGRDLFLGNSLIYILGLIGKATHAITLLDTAPMMLVIFNFVGIASIAACIYLTIKTAEMGTEWKSVLFMGFLWLAGASFYFYEAIAGMTNPPMEWGYPRTVEGFFHALSRGQYEKAFPSDVLHDPLRFVGQLWYLITGVAEEYSWAFMFVALLPFLFLFKMQKRERAWIIGLAAVYGCIGVLLTVIMNPSPDRQSAELLKVFFTSSRAVVAILIGCGLTIVAAYMATHYQKFLKWGFWGGVFAIALSFCSLVSISEKFISEYGGLENINYLFAFIAIGIGLGGLTALVLTVLSVPSKQANLIGIITAPFATLCISIFAAFRFNAHASLNGHTLLAQTIGEAFASGHDGRPIYGTLILVAVAVVFFLALLAYRNRAPLFITLSLFAVTPMFSALTHYGTSEQRNHWFGYWFGHDMFTPPFNGKDGKPLYPEMAKDTILYGGTDPGRFCPTYMIFCESFIPHDCQPKQDQKFDRRDVYLITQNALADGTYLNYLRAQYFRSQQIDPPFFSELARFILKDKDYETNFLAKLVSPLDTYFTARGARIEKRWRISTSLFDGESYTNFPALANKLRESQDPVSKWLFQNFSKETQDLLTQKADEKRIMSAVSDDLNHLLERELAVKKELKKKQDEKFSVDQELSDGVVSEKLGRRSDELKKEIDAIKLDPLYETNRFAGVAISDYLQKFVAQNPQLDTRIRLNRLLLEAAYPNEIVKSLGGVYPDREIYIASNEDSQRCFQEYIADAQARVMHDQQFPNEQRQVKPGEDVHIVDNRVQVSGQIAVMSINGLLTKVIFDKNPDNEFYIEESFPLDWMFPHLTPFGVIMKINRQPLAELTQEICDKDHEFWSQYDQRLIGQWITYDTPVKDVVAFVEKVNLRHDYSDFKGDLKFARDDEAQKAFSKLRSSIGGIYSWRLGLAPSGGPVPGQWIARSEAQRKMLLREANFAFKQAFAYCPYSPEAVYRYIQLLTGLEGRFDDALLIAETCHKLDPENGQITDLVNRLRQAKGQPNAMLQIQKEIAELENDLQKNPTDYSNAFLLASKYMAVQQEERAFQILDGIVDNPGVTAPVVYSVVQAYVQMQNLPKIASALNKYVKLAPDQPDGWYNLAKTEAVLGKNSEAMGHLAQAMKLNSQLLAKNVGWHDLRPEAQKDPSFAALRTMSNYQTLVSRP